VIFGHANVRAVASKAGGRTLRVDRPEVDDVGFGVPLRLGGAGAGDTRLGDAGLGLRGFSWHGCWS